MIETLSWWLAAELIGVAAFPIAFLLFPFLADRGYAFTKALGLVLVGYGLWMGALIGLWPNSRGSVLLILLLLGLTSAVVAGRRRHPLGDFLRQYWDYILFVEVLFTVAFVLAAFLRSYVPEVQHTEQPMDLAFLNGVLRARHFPPEDPWLAGYSLSYYYFGHLMVAALTLLTDLTARVTYNLGLALVAALMAVSIFGLIFNLVRLGGASLGRALLFGLVGIVLLMIIGNLVGFFELLAIHGVGSEGFYQRLGIYGLDGPRSSDRWYPTEWWWWWRSTRVASAWDVKEVPFFSLLLGDLHAHVMAVPFVLMTIGMALNLLRWDGVLDGRFWLRHPWRLGLTALLVGSLAFLNAWDMPTFLLLVLAAVALHNYLGEGRLSARVLGQTASFALPLAILAVLLYLPFYLDFHPVGGGIHPLELAQAVSRGWPPPEATVTQPHHLLYFWFPLLWIATSLAVVALLRQGGGRGRVLLLSPLPALLPLAFWILAVTIRRGPAGFLEEADARGWNWLTLALLATALAALAMALLRHLAAAQKDWRQRSLILALFLGGAGVLILLGAELFWAQDPVGVRLNTVFKLGYQAWIVLAVSGAFGLHYMTWRWRGATAPVAAGRYGWALATTLVLAAALVYPVTASFARTNGFTNQRSLDSLRGVRAYSAAEYDALRWLAQNVDGTPTILEAVGGDYSAFGRVASHTGLPTLLGWPEHEYRWRGSWGYQDGRQADVETAYKTPSVAEARAILDKYNVRYVYVGPLERRQYGEGGLTKFAQFMEVAYQRGDVIIYRLPSPGAVPTVQQHRSEDPSRPREGWGLRDSTDGHQ